MTEFEILDQLLPENLKVAMATGNADAITTAQTGMSRFEFGDIALSVGEKIASRHLSNRKVARGLLALANLKG